MMKTFLIAIATALALSIVPSFAQEFKSGDITIEKPWSRATPKSAPVAGGYMVIHNNGKTSDRLIGGSFDPAKTVQVHEMSMDNGIMKMRQVAGGLEIAAGGTVELKPSGFHMMFMGLTKQLSPGDLVKGTVEFANAGKIQIEFRVGGLGDTGPSVSMPGTSDSMDHGKMQMQH